MQKFVYAFQMRLTDNDTLKILCIVSDYVSSSKMTSESCTLSKKLNSSRFLYIFQ